MRKTMYKLVYPRKAQALFTNRATELEIIESYKERLLRGEANKIAFIGARRIGKSIILHEFIKRNAANRRLLLAYVNLQKLIMEPLSFAKSYIGLLTKWAVKDAADNFTRYDDPQFCMLQFQKRHPRIVEYLEQFLKIIQSREIHLKPAVELALNFPKIVSKHMNKPMVVMLDEFQEIILLRNFKQLPEILGFMRAVLQTHNDVLYIFAGSYVGLMQNIIGSADSPFFGQIKPYYLNNFDKENSLQFLKKVSSQFQLRLSPAVEKKAIELTAGHPFYLELLAEALHEAQRTEEVELVEDDVQKILLLHLVNEKSPLNFHLSYIYEDALGRARGSTILRGILRALAKDGSLTLTEIANRLSRKTGLIQLSLTELMKVDLVIRKEKFYSINDPLLRWWIYFKFYHPEGAFSLQDPIIQELADDFREKYLQATLELGRAKEFELYYFVSKMQGQQVGGATLPAFKTLIKNYVLPNGEEIDLFARNKESWVFELKWKNKLVGMKELQNLKRKIRVDRYVLISKKGFTKSLLEYSQKGPEAILWNVGTLAQT
jgi:AAA+ ATPase superfamily predicted ATPase